MHGFSGKFEKWPILTQIWPKFVANLAECWNSWKSRKNLKVGDFKSILSKFHSYFGKQPVHSESWGPVENFVRTTICYHSNCEGDSIN